MSKPFKVRPVHNNNAIPVNIDAAILLVGYNGLVQSLALETVFYEHIHTQQPNIVISS